MEGWAMGTRRAQQQIEKYWRQPCLGLLQGENPEPEPDDLRLAKLICEQFERGESDIVAVLKKFAMSRSFQKQLF
jgi:hypothetical protein